MVMPPAFRKILKVEKSGTVGITICPDKFVKNDKVSGLVSALYDTYSAPIHRIKWNKGVEFRPKHVGIWEIVITEKSIGFNIYTNVDNYSFVMGRLGAVWPESACLRIPEEESFVSLNPMISDCILLKLADHHMLSLDTNTRQESGLLESLLNCNTLMKEEDKVIIQFVLDPMSDEWQDECDRLYEDYRNTGSLPSKMFSTPTHTFKRGIEAVLDFTVDTIESALDGLSSATDIKGMQKKRKSIKQLSNSTMYKATNHGFNTQIRIACESPDKNRTNQILKAISNSFRELDGDNRLVPTRSKNKKRMLDLINTKSNDNGGEHKSILSVKEVEKMVQLPTSSLQKNMPAVNSIQFRETDVPDILTKQGIAIGSVKKKGKLQKLHYLTSNHDILCLPRVVIGQMGSGKSSYASTFSRSAFVDNNFNVIAVDVADGRMCNQIRDSIPPERKKDVIELDFGKLSRPIGLVWNEAVAGMNNSGNRVTAELLSFMEKITGDFGPQMRRWMKKAAQAVFEDPNSTILDVILMLVDAEYRVTMIPKIKNLAVKQAWIQFQTFNERQQQLIVSPVLNRLDYLLDDENMKNILCQVPKKDKNGNFALDFRELINQNNKENYSGKCILIKVPVAELGEAATDAIVAFLISKIWLTVQTRDRNTVLDNGVPTFLLMDEPHQFMSSVENWKRMVVESRKWRLGLVWFFHTWEQIRDKSKELAKTIKSAGIHYILYNSSKDTWKELAEEILPYTLTEALEIPRYHAFVITHTPEGPVPPMLVKMEAPVNTTHPVYDNSDIAEICLERYSRPLSEVETEITNKELCLLGIDPTKIVDDVPVIDDGKFTSKDKKKGAD